MAEKKRYPLELATYPDDIYKSKRVPVGRVLTMYNGFAMQQKTRAFISGRKATPAAVIPLEELGRYDTAYFEPRPFYLPDTRMLPDLSDVLACFRCNGNSVIALKAYWYRGHMEYYERHYPIRNYGKTWRCWTAVPTWEQLRETEWER